RVVMLVSSILEGDRQLAALAERAVARDLALDDSLVAPLDVEELDLVAAARDRRDDARRRRASAGDHHRDRHQRAAPEPGTPLPLHVARLSRLASTEDESPGRIAPACS